MGLGISTANLVTLSISGHVVIGLDDGKSIARVAFLSEGYYAEPSARELRIAALFDQQIGRTLPSTPQIVADAIVTFQSRRYGRNPSTPADFALAWESRCRSCDAIASSGIDLPPFDAQVAELARLLSSEGKLGMLRADYLEKLYSESARVRALGGFTPSHGDPNPGNILIDNRQECHLIDWECACIAPTEWDGVMFAEHLDGSAGIFSRERLTPCRRLKELLYEGWSLLHPTRQFGYLLMD